MYFDAAMTLRKRRHRLRKSPKKPPAPPAPPARPSQAFAARGKAVAAKAVEGLLDALERDPEAVARGAERAFESALKISQALKDLQRWAKENPDKARDKIRQAVLDGISTAAAEAKKKRTAE